MIDTLELRIHNIAQHLALAEFLDAKYKTSGTTITTTETSNDIPVSARLAFVTTMHYHDTGRQHTVARFNELKSHHYNIAYKIDYNRDFIAFNLSIPKYVFGTNILHYNTPPTSAKFNYSLHADIKKNLRESYKRLFKFIEKFFSTEFGTIGIYYQYVEINRIDLCFNQFFDSKNDALEYLQQMRTINKKYARDSSNFSRDWKTSIMYRNDRYSFKVYHKGSEFKKHDARKLRDLNPTSDFFFDVNYYQEFADKILRYEMTVRNSFMSYLFMRYCFRTDCPIWQHGFKLWTQYKTKKAGKDFIAYRASLTADDKRHIDYVNKYITKTKKFYLAPDVINKEFDAETDAYNFNKGSDSRERFYYPSFFSRPLWDCLADKFCSILDEFKLELKQDSFSIIRKLEAHNDQVDSLRTKAKSLHISDTSDLYKGIGTKIYPQGIRLVLDMLNAGKTFQEIQESGIYSRQTWYNYRKLLASLGVTPTSLLSMTTRADMNLQAYNSELVRNSPKFRHLNF